MKKITTVLVILGIVVFLAFLALAKSNDGEVLETTYACRDWNTVEEIVIRTKLFSKQNAWSRWMEGVAIRWCGRFYEGDSIEWDGEEVVSEVLDSEVYDGVRYIRVKGGIDIGVATFNRLPTADWWILKHKTSFYE